MTFSSNRDLFLSPNLRLPIFALLHPRGLTPAVILSFILASILGITSYVWLDWPKWLASAIFIITMLPIGIAKWHNDFKQYGTTTLIFSVLLISQSLHTIEHIAQWVQYYSIGYTLRESNGLLSPLNAEWVHFVWNTLVFMAVVKLILGGARNGWTWALLIIALFHTLEHTYLLVRYQLVLNELSQLNITNVTAQGLPGFFGRDGWLARSVFTQNTFLCSIPGLTTATRLDVHFWWNILELSLLIPAAHVFLIRVFRTDKK